MADRHIAVEPEGERTDLAALFVRLTGRTRITDGQQPAPSKDVIDSTDPEVDALSESVATVTSHEDLVGALEEPDDPPRD